MRPSRLLAFVFLSLGGATPNADPADPSAAISPDANHVLVMATDEHPRHSEGDVVELPDGRLLLAWTEFGGDGEDHAAAEIPGRISDDGGLSWGPKFTLQPNVGGQNVMSVSFLRRASGEVLFFYLRKDSNRDLTVWSRRLEAGGAIVGGELRWSDPRPVAEGPGYHVMNNDRVIETRLAPPDAASDSGAPAPVRGPGRILCPVAWTADIGTAYDAQVIRVFRSDDGGASWAVSPDLQLRDDRGRASPAMEPGLVELKDGRVLMIVRTKLGRIYRAESRDGGESWSPIVPTELVAPAAPASIARMPTGDLLLAWNDVENGAAARWNQRNPLTFAISRDEGNTWVERRDLETAEGESFAYVSIDFVAREEAPASGEGIGRDAHEALLTYYRHRDDGKGGIGRIDLKLRRIPLGWFDPTL